MSFRTSLFSVFFAATSFVGACVGYVAYAATDGTLGPSSTGRSNIVITVQRELRVNNINDIALGTFDASSAPMLGVDPLCIYDNGLGGYQVTLSSANGTGQFQMENGTSVVTYAVEYDDSGMGANFQSVTEGVPLTGRANASPVNDSCIALGADNARIRVRVTTSDVAGSSTNGLHTDVLSIVVSPSP